MELPIGVVKGAKMYSFIDSEKFRAMVLVRMLRNRFQMKSRMSPTDGRKNHFTRVV